MYAIHVIYKIQIGVNWPNEVQVKWDDELSFFLFLARLWPKLNRRCSLYGIFTSALNGGPSVFTLREIWCIFSFQDKFHIWLESKISNITINCKIESAGRSSRPNLFSVSTDRWWERLWGARHWLAFLFMTVHTKRWWYGVYTKNSRSYPAERSLKNNSHHSHLKSTLLLRFLWKGLSYSIRYITNRLLNNSTDNKWNALTFW